MTNKKTSPSLSIDDMLKILRQNTQQEEARKLLMRILLEYPDKRIEMDEELWKKQTNPSKRKNQ
jgi:hypothetical protein